MVKISAVIGSVGHSNETLVPLVDQLEYEGVRVTVVDNRGTLPEGLLPPESRHIVYPLKNIHVVWNLGMEIALKEGADWCCVLNDDIVLAPGAPALAASMAAEESIWLAGFDYECHSKPKLRWVEGSYRLHGIGGFAYMIRPGVGLRYDERFNWWGGDDDLVWTCIERGGRAVVVEGACVQHPDGGNTTGRHYPEVMGGVAADRELLLEKWKKAW